MLEGVTFQPRQYRKVDAGSSFPMSRLCTFCIASVRSAPRSVCPGWPCDNDFPGPSHHADHLSARGPPVPYAVGEGCPGRSRRSTRGREGPGSARVRARCGEPGGQDHLPPCTRSACSASTGYPTRDACFRMAGIAKSDQRFVRMKSRLHIASSRAMRRAWCRTTSSYTPPDAACSAHQPAIPHVRPLFHIIGRVARAQAGPRADEKSHTKDTRDPPQQHNMSYHPDSFYTPPHSPVTTTLHHNLARTRKGQQRPHAPRADTAANLYTMPNAFT